MPCETIPRPIDPTLPLGEHERESLPGGLLEQPPLKAEGTSLRVEGPDVQLIDSHRELLAACEAFTEADNHDGIQLAYAMARKAIANGRWWHR
jgi:hypothetical protein